MIRSTSIAAVVAVALLATACAESGGSASDEAEVLGLQIDRETPSVEPAPDSTSATSVAPIEDDATEPEPVLEPTREPAPEPSPSAATAAPDPEPTSPLPAPPSRPEPTVAPPPSPAPTTAPTPTPVPTAAEPEAVALTTRQGHSYVTWFRLEEQQPDGTTTLEWGEISAAPPTSRDEGSEPLRVTLESEQDRTAAVRSPTCVSYLEVDGPDTVRARGELRVTVVVDGGPARRATAPVDVTVAPGERVDLVSLTGPDVDVDVHEDATCAVSFVAS